MCDLYFTVSGPADTLTFSLIGASSNLFSIHSSTGVVTLTAALDYEEQTTHSLTVTVSDGKGAMAATGLTVTVSNRNDAPVFQGKNVLTSFDC